MMRVEAAHIDMVMSAAAAAAAVFINDVFWLYARPQSECWFYMPRRSCDASVLMCAYV